MREPEAIENPVPETADWDPHSAAVIADQRSAYDAQRGRCPVAVDAAGQWTLFNHADVLAAATNPETFSSAVSRHRALPNSLDGAEHRAYRSLIDRYLTTERVTGQAEQCLTHARALLRELPAVARICLISDFGAKFAVRAQSTWLGWPAALEQELLDWMADNLAASRSGEYERTAAVAQRFDAIISELIATRRPQLDGGAAPADVTAELMTDESLGRRLRDEEVVSILRNWTAGDLGSIASAIGVIGHFLATEPEVQDTLRAAAQDFDDAALEAGLEEILRIDDPFVTNRRVTTCPVSVNGRELPAGAVVHLNWTSANRDPQVFPRPDDWRPLEHARANLVFGAGPHVCPGRELTLLELRCAVGELLRATRRITLDPSAQALRAAPPVGGWERVPLVLDRN